MTIDRREFLKWVSAAAGVSAASGCATTGNASARVVVVGGGYGGATAARYLRMWAPDVDVHLVEPNPHFISCPMSNLVVGGNAAIGDISMSYDGLTARGVHVVRETATVIDPVKRTVRLSGGAVMSYDRLILSPGIAFMFDRVQGLASPDARLRVPHAWRAGEQTLVLRKQLQAMPDGGVYVMHIPMAPYRCPPGPYERICQIASYFKREKPRSKILVLDSNPDIVSKAGLFRAQWNGQYKGMIDYRPNSELDDVDVKGMTVRLTFDNVKGDVLNVVPPQRAADIARSTGLITANDRWCGIDWRTYESVAEKGIHILGDATLSAPAMPKSASMANQQAKVCAAAVISMLKGEPVNPDPMLMNTCYSFVDAKNVIHVASVHRYDAAERTMIAVKGAGGLSTGASEQEGVYAWGWARNIWADSLA